MAIKLNCPGCFSSFAADDRLAGKMVKCPKCKAKIKVPGAPADGAAPAPKPAKKPEPSMGIDWGLMVEASKPAEQESDFEVQKEADAVDWDAIAGTPKTGPVKVTKEKRASDAFGSPAERTHTPAYDPRAARGRAREEDDVAIDQGGIPMGGERSTEAFMREAVTSLFFSIAYLPQIITLILINIVVQASFFAAVYLAGPLFRNDPHLFVVLFTTILVAINLLYAGYVQRYFMGVTAVTSQGGEAFGLPDFSVLRVLKSLLLAILFALVYIVPIVTIPLAPVAYLVISRTQDLRGFDVPWVAKMTFRYLLHSMTVLVFGVIFLVLVGLVAYLITPLALEFIIDIAPSVTRTGVDFLLFGFVIFVLVPLWLMLLTSLARMVGLIGRHGTWLLKNVPRQTNYGVAIPSAIVTCLLGLVLAKLYLPEVSGYWQRQTGQVATDRPTRDPNVATGNPTWHPGQQRPPRQFPVDPLSEIGSLPPAQQVPQLLGHLTARSPHKVNAIHRLSALGPIAMKDEVLAALENLIRSDPDLNTQLAADQAYRKWGGDNMRRLLALLESPAETQRRSGASLALALPPDETVRNEVLAGLDRALGREQSSLEREKLMQAITRWGGDASTYLARQLREAPAGSRQADLVRQVARLRTADAADAIAGHIRKSPFDAQDAFAALATMAGVAEPAVANLVTDRNSSVRQGAIEWLAAHGSEASLPALREAATDQVTQVAQAARAAWRKLAPQELDAVTEAMLDLSPKRRRTSSASQSLDALAAMEPLDARRSEVLAAVTPMVEARDIYAQKAALVMGRWADDDALAKLKEWTEATRPADSLRRSYAIDGLGANGSEAAAKILVTLLGDSSTRFKAQSALIEIGQPAERDVLRMLQLSKDDDVRLPCVNILEKIGGAGSLQTLIALAKTKVSSPLTFPARRAVIAIQDRLKKE